MIIFYMFKSYPWKTEYDPNLNELIVGWTTENWDEFFHDLDVEVNNHEYTNDYKMYP